MRLLVAVLCMAVLLVACVAPVPSQQAPLDTTPLRYRQERPPPPVSTPVPTVGATAAPAPTPVPEVEERTARQWVAEFVWCTSSPYSPEYSRMFVDDPMPALDEMIEAGALGETLWKDFYRQANPDRFDSILYISCVYDVELPHGAGYDAAAIKEGYEETVCNRMDWLGRDGYDVLKGYILELFYNTMFKSSC